MRARKRKRKIPYTTEVNLDNIMPCRVTLTSKMLAKESEVALRRLFGVWWESHVSPIRQLGDKQKRPEGKEIAKGKGAKKART